MHAIQWLHISDFHLQEEQSKRQNAVLDAMLEDIARRRRDGLAVDFVLVTGDLAASGKASEYKLVKEFLDKLSSTIGLSSDLIYCVPGNHDVDRARQQMCFRGARSALQNQTNVYSFLENAEERETLLTRLGSFRLFQECYFAGQRREPTGDALGYVAALEVRDIRIAIIGLNSAWLSEGGPSDDRQLLLGEPQVVSAIELVNATDAHLVIGMTHHPFDLLREFDRMQAAHRLNDVCDFFHCGHLHVPDASSVVTHSTGCLVLAAGAAYESRESANAYTVVTYEPLHARAKVTFVRYDRTEGAFSNESERHYAVEIDSETSCSIAELAVAIKAGGFSGSEFSYYLAALLLGCISEVPIPVGETVVLGSIAVLDKSRGTEDSAVAAAANEFFAVLRAIRLLYGRKPLDQILVDYGVQIRRYAKLLGDLCRGDVELRSQLRVRDDNARLLAGEQSVEPFRHTSALLDDLRDAEDWDKLREQAERVRKAEDPALVAKAKRMLALCLATSTEQPDRERAVEVYRDLSASSYGTVGDWASLVTLLTDGGNHVEAKESLVAAIEAFPQYVDGFVDIGMKTVEATGDIDFRDWLLRRKNGRGDK